jgi:ribosome-associated translation inhibitor RaiA
MELEIHGQNLRVGEGLHEQVERQMNFALGQFESWISGVSVYLEDVNGLRVELTNNVASSLR